MVFICKLFQSRLQAGQFKSYDVLPIWFMSRRWRYSLRVFSACQKPCSGKIRRGKPQKYISFTFAQISGKRTLHSIRKISPSPSMKYNRGPSSLCMLIRPYLMVKSHLLMLVSWLKAIRTVTFYAMQFWAWSPQPSKMIDFQQEHTPWSRISLACSGYIAWNQIILGIHADFHQLCNQVLTYSFLHML